MVQGSQGNPPNNTGKGTPWWSNPGAAPPGAQPAQPTPTAQAPTTPAMAPPPYQPQASVAPAPAAPPAQTPAAPLPTAPGNEAFGFGPANKDEKYNTEYLSTAMVSERRRSQYIIMGVLAAILGVAMWLVLSPKEQKGPAATPDAQQAAETVPKSEPAKPATDKAVEMKTAPTPATAPVAPAATSKETAPAK